MQLNKLAKNYLKKNISGYVSKDQKSDSLKAYLRLDFGENLLGCSPKVLKAAKSLSLEDLNFYSDPSNQKIKQVISSLYGIQKQNVSIANSSNELIDYLPRIIINPKDKVLIITPNFFRFIESSLACGGKIICQKLKEEDNYELNLKNLNLIVKKIKQQNIKLIWLSNPNNPTGSAIDLKIIIYLLKISKAVMILDEAFAEYADLTLKNSGISLINKYQNLIVLRTLSKAYGLAGLRFAYCLAHKKTIEIIEKCRNTLLLTSAVAQKLAITALKDQQWLKKVVMQTRNLREKLILKIRKNNNLFLAGQSQANIILLRHKKLDLYEKLKEKKILTADFRQALALENKKYVRITVSRQKNNQLLLKALNSINHTKC